MKQNKRSPNYILSVTMMNRIGFVRSLFLLLLCFGLFGTNHVVVQATTTNRYRRTQADPIFCLLSINVVMNQDDSHEEFYSCSLLLDGEYAEGTYDIIPPTNVFGQKHEALLKSGQELFLEIWNAQVTNDAVLLPSDEAVVHVLHGPPPQRQRRRFLARGPSTTGSFRAVMIRIITDDAEPTFDKDTLYNYLFTDDLSVKRQLERCSANLLTMEPDAAVGDGVINVRLSGTTAAGQTNKGLMNLAESIVNREYRNVLGGQSIRDHIDALLFVVPPGTGDWAAFATVSGKSSSYNDQWGGYLGALMHELGHNLGLRHAFQNGAEYEDRSGYMGSAPQRVLYPERCYNGHNFQKLRWYTDRFLQVEPEIPQLVKMAGFVDYSKTRSDEYITVQVGDLFLHYNRVDSFNKDSAEMKNSVVIVKERSDGTDLLNGLTAGTSHLESIYGEEVTIEVCELVSPNNDNRAAYMLVSIGYGDSLCAPAPGPASGPVPQPTTKPAPPPVSRPTLKPTTRPTPSPTRPPTPRPTFRPTPPPTPEPTWQPTRRPPPAPGPTSPNPSPQAPPTPRPTPVVPKPAVPAQTKPPNNNGPGSPSEREPSRVGLGHTPAPSPDALLSENAPPTPSQSAPQFSPPPIMITDEDGKYKDPSKPTGMYDRGDNYNGILIPQESKSNRSVEIGASAGFAIGIVLCGLGCCILLSRRYRIVWVDDEDEILEVREELGAMRRSPSFDKKAETETLASEDEGSDELVAPIRDEGGSRSRGRSRFRGPPKPRSSRPGSLHAGSGSQEEDWNRAIQLWMDLPPGEASPAAEVQRQPPESLTPPPLTKSASPSRQSFQPVVVPSRSPQRKQWFDLDTKPFQTTMAPRSTMVPTLQESLPSRQSPGRHDYPTCLPMSESFDSAYDFEDVVSAKPDQRREVNGQGAENWIVF